MVSGSEFNASGLRFYGLGFKILWFRVYSSWCLGLPLRLEGFGF